MAAAGGTEAFPDLGRHCQHSDCHQLDFLPFTCDGCQKVFCLEHRGFKSHDCPKSDRNSRKVVVCEICSMSIETTGKDGGDESRILERHHESGDCDPRKKKKPTCSARRCREILTFSNTCVCKTCRLKVCLKHRFPAEHNCGRVDTGRWNEKFMAALELRSGGDCGKRGRPTAANGSSPSVKAC
ncbi:zinc finger AN1 domain-containing stress-associated protein 12 isoform X3 [Cucurbita pepo subsp. pepo]|uniref:zinc finger AN1 domain-containing stress-associated protein 12 isoform X1 n=1 Tax=Cucurbita pepo subsp. pepo TaxID=3664 RepID=UPI000C9D3592|nr:zinc finger AN1 domain-containing stress-associated protein 12 isoform X1 [Cucurbita pepo subsp. pepo]XP_023526968.1 zinc finger AN1 domain-containing stress-associated protein 12 isoform X1 [Cucurbita pepo subsp. pepo]XP_023526969.1 zinc finger AN1 domain-containing stress-associated protein 12 isoform X3 [Cucurbita pepo subsp. pepo]